MFLNFLWKKCEKKLMDTLYIKAFKSVKTLKV